VNGADVDVDPPAVVTVIGPVTALAGTFTFRCVPVVIRGKHVEVAGVRAAARVLTVIGPPAAFAGTLTVTREPVTASSVPAAAGTPNVALPVPASVPPVSGTVAPSAPRVTARGSRVGRTGGPRSSGACRAFAGRSAPSTHRRGRGP
jgi:hypothetical protein